MLTNQITARNRHALESEEAREHRLAGTELAGGSVSLLRQPKSERHAFLDGVLMTGHGMQPEKHRQGRHASSSRGLLCDRQEQWKTSEERGGRLH